MYPTPETASAAANAALAAFAASAAADAAASANAAANAAASASAAANAALAAFAANAAADADAAANAADAAAAIWQEVRNDAKYLLAENPELRGIWTATQNNPLVEVWYDAHTILRVEAARLRRDTVDWTFWIDWYERHLAGNPFPPDLMQKIVLLPEEDWTKNPAKLNAQVMALYEEWKLQQRLSEGSYPYDSEFDEASGKLIAVPIETVDLSEIVKDLRQSLRDFNRRCQAEGGDNRVGDAIQASLKPALDELKKLISRHKDTPQKLFEALEATASEVSDRAKQDGLAEDPLVNRLLRDFGKFSSQICLAAPSVQEYQEALAASHLRRAKQSLVFKYAAVTAAMWRESKGDLAAAAEFAVLTVLDDNASDTHRGQAYLFLERMTVRAALAKKEALANGHEVKKSKSTLEEKLSRAGEVGKNLSNIDKGIDGLQEAFDESSKLPWDSLLPNLGSLFGS
ncbi:MAG: hypothetical protein AAF618_01120 [Pseudomonadota bacterium]